MIDDVVDRLVEVKDEIARLEVARRELEAEILASIDFNPDGQKTIEMMRRKIIVHAGKSYRVDKEKYDAMSKVAEGFNPVKKSVSYSVDSKIWKQLDMYPEFKAKFDGIVLETPKAVRIEVL